MDVSEERTASIFSVEENPASNKPKVNKKLIAGLFFLVWFTYISDLKMGGSTFLRNVGKLPDYTASHSRR
jgi:hypothetical protein